MGNEATIRELLDQGLTFYGLGQIKEAIEIWRRVLELDPGNARAQEYLKFVQVNWAPDQPRDGEPYRPDEGSDPTEDAAVLSVSEEDAAEREQPVPGSLAPEPAQPTPEPAQPAPEPVQPAPEPAQPEPEPAQPAPEPAPPAPEPAQPAPEPAQPAPEPAQPAQVEQASLSRTAQGKEAFSAPAMPVVKASQWGDLYDFGGGREETAASEPAVKKPQTAPAEASEVPEEPQSVVQPEEHQKAPSPNGPAATGASRDESQDAGTQWATEASVFDATPGENSLGSDAGQQDEAAAGADTEQGEVNSTLPPYPSSTDPSGQEESSHKSPAVEPPVVTRSYESMPTVVRQSRDETGQAVPAGSEEQVQTPDPPLEGPAGDVPTAPGAEEPSAAPGMPQDSTLQPSETDAEVYEQVSQTQPQPAEDNGALDLIAGTSPALKSLPVEGSPQPPEPEEETETLLKGAVDMLELDDFSGAMELLKKVLEREPDNEKAIGMRAEAENELMSIYSSKVGELDRVPRVRMAGDEMIWLNLDHRAGFVLSLVDGNMNFDEILSVCGLDTLDAMRILAELLQDEVIEV